MIFNVKINKKGQEVMGMPFSLIFAIFLIIVFIIVAFIAVNYFLNIEKSTSVGLFYKELQEEVDKSMSSQSGEAAPFKITLPSKITYVCFANLSAKITGSQENYERIHNYRVYDANTFLLPPEYAEGMAWKQIDHLNITKMTATSNPYCVETSEDLTIKKGFYDRWVIIE